MMVVIVVELLNCWHVFFFKIEKKTKLYIIQCVKFKMKNVKNEKKKLQRSKLLIERINRHDTNYNVWLCPQVCFRINRGVTNTICYQFSLVVCIVLRHLLSSMLSIRWCWESIWIGRHQIWMIFFIIFR